mmetsp:Transcript_52201/g.162029  ORF Transcript_52201/g.162029 Transcript_52201/m.162029 type:complete len:82 (+) Transcript_52201:393-638(+)
MWYAAAVSKLPIAGRVMPKARDEDLAADRRQAAKDERAADRAVRRRMAQGARGELDPFADRAPCLPPPVPVQVGGATSSAG